MSKGKKVYRYSRNCQYKPCGDKFETNREWQKFCNNKSPNCHDEYWKDRRRSNVKLQKEVNSLRKEVDELKKNKGTSV